VKFDTVKKLLIFALSFVKIKEKGNFKMDKIDKMEQIPRYAYEVAEAKSERITKRLILALVFSIILIFASNAIWLYAWCQYDYSSEETSYVDVDGKNGNANYIGNNGEINNGSDNGKDSQKESTTVEKSQ
jgi:hypothetical protein